MNRTTMIVMLGLVALSVGWIKGLWTRQKRR